MKSFFSSPILPLLLYAACLGLVFAHTGTFRIKSKTNPFPSESRVPRPLIPVSSSADDRSVAPSAFVALLETASKLPVPSQPERDKSPGSASSGSGQSEKESQPSGITRMCFLSMRDEDKQAPEEGFGAMIPCQLVHSISNATDGSKILINGAVSDNIQGSSGKILIEAGTKVLGYGQIDALSGRIKSLGKWSLVTDNHVLRTKAKLLESSAGREGLKGQETSPEATELQKAAIVRDGLYLYVAEGQKFTLELLGQFELKDLRPIDTPVVGLKPGDSRF